MSGFNNGQETKYSAQQETKYSAQQGFPPPQAAPTSHTPPAASSAPAYHSSGADFINRYKLEQTIRQLHGIHSADPRSTFPTSFTGGV